MFKSFSADIRKYLKYSLFSARSQLKSEVSNSYLNWIWWVLDPLCFMLIYTFIFGYVFGASEQYFPVYIFIGLTIWDFFNKTLLGSIKIIKANKPIVSKVYFPKYILILTRLWVNGFKMLISFGIIVAMMLFWRIPISFNILFVPLILTALALLTFGCSCFLLHFGVYVEDLSNVTAIVLRFVFYATGVFYNIESKIPQWGYLLNRANPVAFLMTSLRQCMLYQSSPDWKLLLAWLAIGLILSVAGIRKIYKEENSYVKSI